MLLEFRAKNYKTFRDELSLSFVPSPAVDELPYSVLEGAAEGGARVRGLCSAVVYGPNAAGKTNVIGAMGAFKSILLRGHLRNNPGGCGPDAAADALELIPNAADKEGAPVSFAIRFLLGGMVVDYRLSARLGRFLDRDAERAVLREKLLIGGEPVFDREGGEIRFGGMGKIAGLLSRGIRENREGAEVLARDGAAPDELFLMNGFRTIFSPALAGMIAEWMSGKLKILYRPDAVCAAPPPVGLGAGGPGGAAPRVSRALNSVIRSFGGAGPALGYAAKGDGPPRLCTLFPSGGEGGFRTVPAEIYESRGTVRMAGLTQPLLDVLENGGFLAVDEFDASIHPTALMSWINIFHNDSVNVRRAQLLFNTHNPVFLNGNLFRRDEIHFIERDDETQGSVHYTLADFDGEGAGPGRGADYMKNYFGSRYGAIRDVDFTPAVLESIGKKGRAT